MGEAMTTNITIPLATLEQLVGALNEVDQRVDLKRYDTAPNEVLFDVVMAAITVARAAIDGTERVEQQPIGYIHKGELEYLAAGGAATFYPESNELKSDPDFVPLYGPSQNETSTV